MLFNRIASHKSHSTCSGGVEARWHRDVGGEGDGDDGIIILIFNFNDNN